MRGVAHVCSPTVASILSQEMKVSPRQYLPGGVAPTVNSWQVITFLALIKVDGLQGCKHMKICGTTAIPAGFILSMAALISERTSIAITRPVFVAAADLWGEAWLIRPISPTSRIRPRKSRY